MSGYDFDSLVEMAADDTGPVVNIGVLSVLDTKCDPGAYYRVRGGGLWRAQPDKTGITLTRLFSSEEIRLDVPGWRDAVARGLVRQVN